MRLDNFLKALSRRKVIDEDAVGESALARVLSVYDLTALGVGATLGAGVYVLTGSVASTVAGPSVIVSFFIAAITSVLSGLCYAEFGARVPKAGSGYIYSYVTVGELCAFIIGWNLVLSYVIGAASVARAWTANFDALLNNTIEKHMLTCCKMDLPGLAEYPDFFSFFIVFVLTCLIAFGVKEFATVNKIFTILNVLVIIFVVIAGLTQADIHNWAWTPEEIVQQFINQTNSSLLEATIVPFELNGSSTTVASVFTQVGTAANEVKKIEYGVGGFFPFGFSGLISGTATCFYAFVGFDCIATTGEEAINPQRSIPLGIVFSLAICCLAYLGISSTLTLMQPYFLLDEDAPLPFAFEYVNLHWARYPVSVGAICALSTSLLGAMFPMPRIIYAMAMDGLLFKFLSRVHEKTKTPLIATFVSGIFAGIMAIFFDLKELVDLMSIGTLAAYTLVAVSVLVLRYQEDSEAELDAQKKDLNDVKVSLTVSPDKHSSFKFIMLMKSPSEFPTSLSSGIVNYATAFLALDMTAFSIVAILGGASGWSAGHIAILCIFGFFMIVGAVVIWCQPQSKKKLSFEVPLVPLVPLLNMFVNIYLMISLPASTWYKMVIWMFAGFLIYFIYGIPHSSESETNRMKKTANGKKKIERSPLTVMEEQKEGLLVQEKSELATKQV